MIAMGVMSTSTTANIATKAILVEVDEALREYDAEVIEMEQARAEQMRRRAADRDAAATATLPSARRVFDEPPAPVVVGGLTALFDVIRSAAYRISR